MLKLYIGVSIIVLIPILTLYISIKIRRDQSFVMSSIDSELFTRNILNEFSGFIICAEKETIINKLKLLRILSETLRKFEPCVIVDVTKDNSEWHLDVNFIQRLQINVLPCIIHIKQGSKPRELVNFMGFNTLSDQEIIRLVIKEIKKGI
ncbi:hypothetical protein D3C74_202570 [compost metagenome]